MHWRTDDRRTVGVSSKSRAGNFKSQRKEMFFFLLQVFYAKEKGKRTWVGEKSIESDRNLMKGIFVHSHPNCPKSLSFENLSQNSFKPLFLTYCWQFLKYDHVDILNKFFIQNFKS